MSVPSALMYHALYGTPQEYEALEVDERPYALSRDMFAAHLQSLLDEGILVVDPTKLPFEAGGDPGVLITFDDGHVSNARIATDLLAAKGARAIFFLTAGHIGARRSACSWADVRQMQQAGMVIGAHGYSHRFISQLDAGEAKSELVNSKREIEQRLGTAVVQMSFPGGMYGKRDIELAAAAGYRVCHTSDIALDVADGLEGLTIVPRLAVRHSDKARKVLAWVRQDTLELSRLRLTSWAKRTIRQALGPNFYHKAYQWRARRR